MINYEDIEILHVNDGEVSIAVLSVGGVSYASGSAKRHPKDMPNAQTGHDLSTARALENLAQLIRSNLPEDVRDK